MSNHRVFAALYDRLTEHSERAGVASKRRELIAPLRGAVVEIGAGTGANLEYYQDIDSLLCIEPDLAMRERLQRRVSGMQLRFPVEVSGLSLGESPLPLIDGSVDAVVSTLVLCSVHDVGHALAELRRILRAGGSLVVIEHVRADGLGHALQNILNPVQKVVAAGCNLNRDTKSALSAAGFDVSGVHEWSIPGSLPLLRRAIVGKAVLPN